MPNKAHTETEPNGEPERAGILKRWIFGGCGLLFLGLGIVGVVVPLLPTTPFLLAAAWCFAKSSRRLYDWMHTNRYFGEHLRRYRAGEGVGLSTKVYVLAVLWVTLALSGFYALSSAQWHGRLFLLAVGIGVTAHLMWIPTRRGKKSDSIPSSAP